MSVDSFVPSFSQRDWLLDHCPCLDDNYFDRTFNRILQGAAPAPSPIAAPAPKPAPSPAPPEPWEPWIVGFTLIVMLVCMMTDYIGPDWVMAAGVTFFMTCQIITIKQGLEGFSNEGILTVMALFVVAEGVSRTGALDHYMGMILGRPKTVAGAQLRITVPIAIISAFLNNTPIVAVMIPLTLRWAKTIGVPRQQLLMHLSYATILGGTCSLVGTSTNLVVDGLLQKNYPDEPAGNMGLLDLAIYGVPNAIIGIAYMLIASPFLLPFGSNKATGLEQEDVLMGARVMPWSPASGRTVKRSGLAESGGIYLAHVRRAATGNSHFYVSDDFVLSVGDELYFTGSITEFSRFCDKHGLSIITTDNLKSDLDSANENETKQQFRAVVTEKSKLIGNRANDMNFAAKEDFALSVGDELYFTGSLADFRRFCETHGLEMVQQEDVGTSKESIVNASDGELQRLINHLSDEIRGKEPYQSTSPATKIIVTSDAFHTKGAVMIGIDCYDRAGLLMEISKAIFSQNLQLKHSEAKVIDGRSLSIWRCQTIESAEIEIEELYTALSTKLFGSVIIPKAEDAVTTYRGVVTKYSKLIGKTAEEVNFRETYKAGIIALQKNGKNAPPSAKFAAGDVVILHVSEGSPLLSQPPENFYKDLDKSKDFDRVDVEANSDQEAWKDIAIEFEEGESKLAHVQEVPAGEFLTAFTVVEGSALVNRSLNQVGYSRLPGVVLVAIERPTKKSHSKSDSGFTALSVDDPLKVGDVFWYTGSAEAIGDLRKVHGLVFYQHDQMKKAVPTLQDRRLVQAVIARNSVLIGRTIKEVKFRHIYGGAVISIQRGSDRVHEHPGDVKLQMGDVLLIDAPPSFVDRHSDNYRTFALLTEVENSSPPRPALFLLCVVIIAASLTIAALDIESLLITASLVGIIMVGCGIVTQQEARNCLQWDLYVVVACAFGVANAMTSSGLAATLADFLVRIGIGIGIGDAGVYGAVYLSGNLLSAILTNNAAASLMFPIAMEAVDKTGCDRLKMSFILMLSASDYITSFGYQTNLMVFSAGGYSNSDFLKFGAPMQVLLWLSSTAMVSSGMDANNFYVSWLICAIGFIFIAAVRLGSDKWAAWKQKQHHDQQMEL